MTHDQNSSKKDAAKKKPAGIAEADKEILEKYGGTEDPQFSADEVTILEIITKRKTVKMITLEVNLALKPLGKSLMTAEQISGILKSLKDRDLVVSIIGGDGSEYWVDKNFFREKLFGTDKL